MSFIVYEDSQPNSSNAFAILADVLAGSPSLLGPYSTSTVTPNCSSTSVITSLILCVGYFLIGVNFFPSDLKGEFLVESYSQNLEIKLIFLKDYFLNFLNFMMII